MNKREKTLAVIVVAFMVLVLGRAAVKTLFLAPLDEKDRDIQAIAEKIEKKKRELKTKNLMIQHWRSVSKKSLDSNPGDAFLVLSARVTTLINASGLRDVSVKPVPINARKGKGVDLYYPIAVNLSARGNVGQIVKFLELVRNEPYIVKITGFTLRPEGRDDLLTISNCRIESIVPASPVLEKIPAVDGRAEVTATQPAVKAPANSQYAMIVQKNIFTPKKTPPPAPPSQHQTPIASRTPVQPTTQVVSRGPGNPGDLVGTITVGSESGAYIRNHIEIGWYKVGDRLANQMQLKFVHPLGIVLRNGSDKIYYVEVGGNINQARPLSETAVPELYQAYQAIYSVH